MKHSYWLIIFMVWACRNSSTEEINVNPVISPDSIKGPYNFLAAEFKRVNQDTLRAEYHKDFTPKRDLFDLFAIRRGDSILIINQCMSCFFTTNSFIITLKDNHYSCILEEPSCTYSINFNPYRQKLILDDTAYQPGDTIRGYIDYTGRYSPDSLNRFYEEVTVKGSFRTVLRDSSYNFREERVERIKAYAKDTLEVRRRHPWWFK